MSVRFVLKDDPDVVKWPWGSKWTLFSNCLNCGCPVTILCGDELLLCVCTHLTEGDCFRFYVEDAVETIYDLRDDPERREAFRHLYESMQCGAALHR